MPPAADTHRPPVLQRPWPRRRSWLAALAVVAVLVAALAGPSVAWGADYRCAQVDLVAQVETNGAVSVVDQRIFEFASEDGTYPADEAEAEADEASAAKDEEASSEKEGESATVGKGDTPADGAATATELADTAPHRQTLEWLYDGFGEDAEVTIKRVRMAAADAEGNVTGEWRKLKPITFVLSWRDGGGPEKEAWSFDKYRSTLYAYIENVDERVVFEVTYTVRHAVTAYDDAGDFSWEYAPRNYPVDLHQVRAQVVLPVPADDKVQPGENVRAWGHGPADGTVDIEKDGTVTFADPQVPSQAYALGRVMFPVGWLTNMPDDERFAHQGSLQYEYTTRYEEGWVDSASYQKITRDGLSGGLLALAALALVGAVGAYARWGRQKPPRFTDDYSSDVPDAALAPAVLGRLWRWNHLSFDDVMATVADMVLREVVVLRESAGGSGEIVFDPWREAELSENESREANQEEADAHAADQRATPEAVLAASRRDVMDAATLRLLTFVSQGDGVLSTEQLVAFAHQRPGAFLRAVNGWQQVLTATVEPYGFFDSKSRRAQRAMLVVAALLAVAGVAALFVLGVATGLLTLAAAAAVGVLANYTMRRSPAGNEITAHAKALRNWMRDGGPAAEAWPEGAVEALVPYGVLFGVLDQLPPTKLGALVQRGAAVGEGALRSSSRRAEVAGSTGEAPLDQGVEPHWRPFWRRSPSSQEDQIDDDF
ncbi:DUF2207 domain-containing protein [Adlercreutzia equolifaciens]|uniref:DUF2207 family protein n=1 Tax=Adlercreutzia equolifaciens TaxID=446660 RepID=UPI0023AED008|nr:DUF2207 domain-containing protein [Adlercreutzia equolifaciens]MDE8701681.1 DUF2207 domain-containing protein [Adlercreutzia equolifaciens]